MTETRDAKTLATQAEKAGVRVETLLRAEADPKTQAEAALMGMTVAAMLAYEAWECRMEQEADRRAEEAYESRYQGHDEDEARYFGRVG